MALALATVQSLSSHMTPRPGQRAHCKTRVIGLIPRLKKINSAGVTAFGDGSETRREGSGKCRRAAVVKAGTRDGRINGTTPGVRRLTQVLLNHYYLLVGWDINVPFQQKKGYIMDKVLGGDLVPPG